MDHEDKNKNLGLEGRELAGVSTRTPRPAQASCAEMIACGVDDEDPAQTMRHAKECPAYVSSRPALLQFMAGPMSQGFVEGPFGYLVADTDFCYSARGLRENIDLRITWAWEERRCHLFTLDELRAVATPITSFREWGHYWGIKGRIAANYRDFLKAMESIGADVSDMPKWGEEPVTAAKAGRGDKRA